MNIYDTFEQKLDLLDAKEFPLSADGASIKLRRMSSDVAKRAFEKLLEPYAARRKHGGELTEEESKKLNIEFFSKTIIMGWNGLKDREKKEIKFSSDAAAALIGDEKMVKFFGLIAGLASDDDAFEQQVEAEAEGNSSAS